MRTDTDRNKGRFSALLGPLATLPGIGAALLLVMASVWNLLPARACPDDRCGCAPGTGSRPG